MKKIKAEIVADSKNQHGDRITTYLLTFPRFILAELNTHRVFSKNSASSRAIPFEKMVKMVQEDPFIPIAWQKRHSGMQGTEYFTDTEMPNSLEKDWFKNRWLEARDNAVSQAIIFNNAGVTKQLCNRLLEPFMWHTVLLTGTEFENFFELRCPKYITLNNSTYKSWNSLIKDKEQKGAPKDWIEGAKSYTTVERLQNSQGQAEIHMQALAEAMWDAYNESTPKELKEGEWHIPFGDKIQLAHTDYDFNGIITNEGINKKLKISTARCARLSYMTFDGEIDYEKDIKLHNTLLESHHMSPFEHCAKAMNEEEYYSSIKGSFQQEYEIDVDGSIDISTHANNSNSFGWCNNFKGFIQYRYLIENNYGK